MNSALPTSVLRSALPFSQREFRDALGQFTTGVALVTAVGPDGPVGITANSFAAVSLEPPLVLWSPARRSSRFPIFAEADLHGLALVDATRLQVVADFSEELAKKVLTEHDITVIVRFYQGDGEAKAWGCDLTYDYVKINADYRS